MVKSLGYVTVTAAGTPVRATVNQPDPALRIGAQAVLFQALPGNAGIVYVGLGGTTMDPTTGTGIVGIVPAPADPTSGPFPSVVISIPVMAAGLNVADFYLDASGNGNGVLVSYTQG